MSKRTGKTPLNFEEGSLGGGNVGDSWSFVSLVSDTFLSLIKLSKEVGLTGN